MMESFDSPLSRPKFILLDVYETMLDMSEIKQKVNTLLNSSKGYRIWFELFMQYCFVSNCSKSHHPFSEIAKATLSLAANALSVQLNEDQHEEILWRLIHLPLKTDVQEALSLLSDAGYQLGALTNSPKATVVERMEKTGLISYFQFVMSAEEVQKYKPAKEVYERAVQKAGYSANEMLMVSSHSWDLMGAHAAGIRIAYVGKPKLFYSLAPTPDYSTITLLDLAMQLQQ